MTNTKQNQTESQSTDTDINNVVIYDDSGASGEYYTLDETWSEIPCYPSGKYRIGVTVEYAHKEVRLFVGMRKNATIITLENDYKLFDRKDWIELRRKRGINKYKPLSVDKNGTIWIGENQHGTDYRVFVKY
jgi:hypothetical protein